MSVKNKNQISTLHQAVESAKQAGIVIMAAAATLGLVEVPDHNRVVLPLQQTLAPANAISEENNPVRREREESEPHYISYSEVQRTVSRSGRRH